MADHPACTLLIAGEALTGKGREGQDIIDPATGETIGSVPHATAADLDRALEAAERGFRTWRSTSADQRTAILLKAVGLIRERAAQIGEALTREQGKPISPCAFVVLSKRGALTIQELQNFLEESKLAKQKFPEKLFLLDSMPTTPSGKVQKHVLRARCVADF